MIQKGTWLLAILALLVIAVYAASVRPAPPPDSVVQLKAGGMRCAACAEGIEGVLMRLPGVGSAQVNVNSGSITVCYVSKLVRPETIAATLTDLGYETRIVGTRGHGGQTNPTTPDGCGGFCPR